ncbi:hypothetical protein D915_008081 [Fasciola hepatica]|uniref:Uncharacterized protein n=1 Tax=Fasciola hepatica TaxID=6192 RepID=A0A4E0RGX0_FASHE|nr:hypothetical protein D915_008081 [Fasciola hepatica]
MKIVHEHVKSLPVSKASQEDQNTLNGLGIRALSAKSREFDHVSETVKMLSAFMNLPARRPVKFDGELIDYFGFMRYFQSTVTRHDNDRAYLLDYLISVSEQGPAEAIRWCTVLEPQGGYDEALLILESLFGKPHVIVRKCIDELCDGSVLKLRVVLNPDSVLVR